MTDVDVVRTIESAAPSAPTRDHATYCGGSDIAAILGIDPHKSPLDVWAEKTRRLVTEASAEMEAGNDHESAIITGYRRRLMRLELVDDVVYPGPGTLLSPKDRRRGATPDAIALHRGYGKIGAQAKFVGYGMAPEWGDEEDGPDGVPPNVIVQVTWEALHIREVLGVRAEVAHVAADIGTDRRVYEVPIDDSMISDLLDAFADWWRRHVVHDEMPIVSNRDRDTIGRLFPRAYRPLCEEAAPDVEALARQYDTARSAAKLVTAEQDRVASLLTARIGGLEGFKGGWGTAVWRNQERTRTDWQAVASALGAPPDLIAAHTTTTASRRLDVRLKKHAKKNG